MAFSLADELGTGFNGGPESESSGQTLADEFGLSDMDEPDDASHDSWTLSPREFMPRNV
jgi:hypothetical protein